MKLNEALIFVGVIWTIYITLYVFISIKFFKVYPNIRRSWTGARYFTNRLLTIGGERCYPFSLNEYRNVPRVFRIVRRDFVIYRISLVVSAIVFVTFVALGVYTAVVCWNVIGTPNKMVPTLEARILLCGHIVTFFVALGTSGCFFLFNSKYAEHYYTISDDGELEKQAA